MGPTTGPSITGWSRLVAILIAATFTLENIRRMPSSHLEIHEEATIAMMFMNQTTLSSTTTSTAPVLPCCAYVYVIGGVKPENPVYRNYFFDILISTHLQRKEGSIMDVIVFVQLSHASEYDKLPAEDLRVLEAMRIQVLYIPKSKQESFYRIMLDKFRMLELTQYQRVLFMDGDVMARGSLDYLFESSFKGVLKPNVVMAGSLEPANGGLFMLAPKVGSRERVLEIVRDKEERGARLPYPHWDNKTGWGHALEVGETFDLINGRKLNVWSFHGDFADQGLLIQWVKYEEKAVSIIHKGKIENWGVNESSGRVVLEEILSVDDVFPHSPKRNCWRKTIKFRPCMPPHNDFVHFTGQSKPWLRGPPTDFGSENKSALHFWFHTLGIVNEELDLGLNFSEWQTGRRPLLGLFPKHVDAARSNYTGVEQTNTAPSQTH